jgi:hypothetical protein
MPLQGLECQLPTSANSEMCPRPTARHTHAGMSASPTEGGGGALAAAKVQLRRGPTWGPSAAPLQS